MCGKGMQPCFNMMDFQTLWLDLSSVTVFKQTLKNRVHIFGCVYWCDVTRQITVNVHRYEIKSN